MHVNLTTPLIVRLGGKKKLELLPVAMGDGFPSKTPALFARFVKKDGVKVAIDEATEQRVRLYMDAHGTEALTEDAVKAFTVVDNALVACDPSVCGPMAGLTAI